MAHVTEEMVRSIGTISARIQPYLHGHSPAVQGGVLADLVSLWLAGHRPDLREQMLDGLVTVIRELIPASEQMAKVSRQLDETLAELNMQLASIIDRTEP